MDSWDHLFGDLLGNSRDPPVSTNTALGSQAHATVTVWASAAHFTDLVIINS